MYAVGPVHIFRAALQFRRQDFPILRTPCLQPDRPSFEDTRKPTPGAQLDQPDMHTALIGASRGIGRATALRLLENPQNIVSLLLRTPSSIEADPDFQIHIGQGRVRIVAGDAEKPEDLARLFEPKGIDSIVITLGMLSSVTQT